MYAYDMNIISIINGSIKTNYGKDSGGGLYFYSIKYFILVKTIFDNNYSTI